VSAAGNAGAARSAHSGTASTREAVAAALVELAAADPAVVMVCPDSVKALRATAFAARFPDRLFDVGIAEQHAVAFAAGLASCGLKPFVGTYAGFLTMRACEQLRSFVAYPRLNVKVLGVNGGILAGEREGPSHQFFEDLAIARTLPGFTVVAPADADQAGRALHALAAVEGPGYLRLGSGRDPVVFPEPRPFELGRARVVAEHGSDVAIFAHGALVGRSLAAADALAREGVAAVVVEVHTLKPLDAATVTAVLERTGAAVTAEDHTIVGGLGSAIAEAAAERCPVPIERVGLRDVFPESGEGERLLDRYGMGVADIATAARRVLARKRAGSPQGAARRS
jgi:transketolase